MSLLLLLLLLCVVVAGDQCFDWPPRRSRVPQVFVWTSLGSSPWDRLPGIVSPGSSPWWDRFRGIVTPVVVSPGLSPRDRPPRIVLI